VTERKSDADISREGAEAQLVPPISDLVPPTSRDALKVAATAFVVLFCIVGLALWGLPFYYDFMVQQFGWSRAQVTSGNALSKLLEVPYSDSSRDASSITSGRATS
jgi:hypothetical protein